MTFVHTMLLYFCAVV
ncbi:TPA: DUF1378 family protein, partial [Escherichia coli]|nr:DUF1378 family protein [Escherichia coli]EER9407178.1 DUF1378 family protein [Escherichia coli]EET1513479.1 DUF1378 family protein [Escherichia coli]EET8441535.1 DUF1378 family protein [Escherichia coli]EEV0550941.1 DUF1378 family protein [Escherichia coli]